MTVEIRRRTRGEPETETVEWPQGWPLPTQGTIVLGHRLAGWCEHVEMDIPNSRVIVVLRPN